MSVTVRVEQVIIPTYEVKEADKNPMFLEKRVYQGSSGRVYPHPVTEGVADTKTEKEYTAVFLENEYLLVMLLPELGGRVQRLLDKTNGYDAVYYNEVIKPALVGLAGPWISGGIEFNWPQHHRPSTFDPLSYEIDKKEDGSITVWVSEIEKMFHTKGMAGFTLYPGKAYLEIRGQLYNPTERTQTFLWWANPAVAVNDMTQSVFPPDVHAVMDHGKRDVSSFPIATGTYYKVDYSAGVDISRYRNIPVPTSYMAYHSDYDFVGNYDHGKQAGLLHVADHHISPGKKQWTWGNGDFGRAWDRNLTDENGPYIELMTGVFTDNQPDFTFIAPYEEKEFVQYFMPYKGAGAVKNATKDVMINLEERNGKAWLAVYATSVIRHVMIELRTAEGELLYTKTEDLSPRNAWTAETEITKPYEEGLKLTVYDENGCSLLSCQLKSGAEEPVPEPAKPALMPQEIATAEELYLTALHLEQYRHATYSPEDYYLEGLKRDKTDIRLNHGYGKYLYNRGEFKRAEPYFREAVRKSIWKNPNPYDSEPYYSLGLCLVMQGRKAEGFDAFYKAAWSAAMQDRAYYQMALLACGREAYEEALYYTERSLVRNLHNLKARNLKALLLRLLKRTEEALAVAEETKRIDAVDYGCRYELWLLTGNTEEFCSWQRLMRGDVHNYIELALSYIEAGLKAEAAQILRLSDSRDILQGYYLAYCTDTVCEEAEYTMDYCFPNRLYDILVLQEAMRRNPKDFKAPYLLGCLYYDKGRHEEAAECFKISATQNPDFPTSHRNLSLYYYNKKSDKKRALQEMEQAFSLNRRDARVFFELDQLYKKCAYSIKSRLELMEKYRELTESRDDLYTEYITLLNLEGRYEEALSYIKGHQFHPWEGGEGKIPAQYRTALIGMAREKAQKNCRGQAEELLKEALSYPHNLGEGKLIGAHDNDIYYYLGMLSEGEQAEKYYRLASEGTMDMQSAMYYNDQPPEMYYYQALAYQALGGEKAGEMFDRLLDYGIQHKKDNIKIDYFAVSLPDLLIYETDFNKKNELHCLFMQALAYEGKGERKKAEQLAGMLLSIEPSHQGAAELLRSFTWQKE